MSDNDIIFTPTKDQYHLLSRPERFKFAIAGVQGGKTWLGAMWATMKVAEFPAHNGLIAAPTYKILQQSTLPKFFELFPQSKAWWKKGDSEIHLPGGGIIFLRSTEEPKHIEGMTVAWAWFDEIGQMKYDAWINVQARIATMQGDFMGTTTPYALNWLYREIYRPWKDGLLEDTYIHQWRSVDNPYFPKAEWDRAQSTMDARTFARRYEAKFEQMEGLVYEEFDPRFHVIDELKGTLTLGSPLLKIQVGGIDFGYNNPSAMLAAYITNDDHWFIVDEWYYTQKTNSEIIEKAKQWEVEHGIRFWYPDTAEPDRLEEMRRAGMYIRETSKKMDEGINSVRQLLKEKRISIVRSTCPNLLEELSTYQYAEPTGEGTQEEKPVRNQADHALDALRYMIHSHQPSSADMAREKMRNRPEVRERRARTYQFD